MTTVFERSTFPPDNLLGGESSPYLLQHAHNPVHWRPWGAAALAEAKARDCPILISIGYAACHWCHVMAHESFEDEGVASEMNRLFVNVKVDREERPDIDHIYMSALHAMGQQGGWPLTMFLTPDGAPMYGGTYWPPEPRWGRPSFLQVLRGVDNAWRTRRDEMIKNSQAMTAHLANANAPGSGEDLRPDDLTRVGEALLRMVDPVEGGLKGAPKFPNAPIFRFFWNERFRRHDPRFDTAVRDLLDALSAGGIYDHLGGGFARYSTDAQWLVPHFEKMLYDNAQILELLAFAQAETPNPIYAERAHETFGWLMREMRVGDAFAASQDADQDGEEGQFYVWSVEEIDAALVGRSPAFKAAYDVAPGGNWEGRTVLRRVVAQGSADEEADLAASRALLFAQRETRAKPARDDKILADWNGLAISALTRAAAAFDAPEFLAAARAAFDFISANLRGSDGRLAHAWRAGRVSAAGMLDDYAAMARAAIALFEATGAPDYLEAAELWAREALALFGDGEGGLFLTAHDAIDVPGARSRHANDNATPAGAGVMVEVFARLFHLTAASEWDERARRLIRAFAGPFETLAGSPSLLTGQDILERGGCVVIDGPLGDPAAQRLADVALATPDPAISVLRFDRSLWTNRDLRPDLPTLPASAALLCRGRTCSLPVATPEALVALIRERP